MPDDIIIIYCHIGCAPAYINKHNTCLLLIVGKNGIRRGEWFKNQILNIETRLADTFFNITG